LAAQNCNYILVLLTKVILVDNSRKGTNMNSSTNVNSDVLLCVWIGLAVLAVIIQALMAIWVAKDAKRSAKSVGWAAFVAIPAIGLIGLFIYILLPGGETEEERNRREMLANMQQQLRQKDAKINEIQEDANRRIAELANQRPLSAPAVNKHTMIIDAVPSRVVNLTQFGGKNHGMNFSLTMKGPDGSLKKNRIGRNASCELSFPEDDNISGEHCIILEDQDTEKVSVIDLGSANGTILERNGDKGKISKNTILQDGDYLVLGETRLKVMIIEPLKKPEQLPEFQY